MPEYNDDTTFSVMLTRTLVLLQVFDYNNLLPSARV